MGNGRNVEVKGKAKVSSLASPLGPQASGSYRHHAVPSLTKDAYR